MLDSIERKKFKFEFPFKLQVFNNEKDKTKNKEECAASVINILNERFGISCEKKCELGEYLVLEINKKPDPFPLMDGYKKEDAPAIILNIDKRKRLNYTEEKKAIKELKNIVLEISSLLVYRGLIFSQRSFNMERMLEMQGEDK